MDECVCEWVCGIANMSQSPCVSTCILGINSCSSSAHDDSTTTQTNSAQTMWQTSVGTDDIGRPMSDKSQDATDKCTECKHSCKSDWLLPM